MALVKFVAIGNKKTLEEYYEYVDDIEYSGAAEPPLCSTSHCKAIIYIIKRSYRMNRVCLIVGRKVLFGHFLWS